MFNLILRCLNDTFSTPILFLIFNRPDLTARVFQRIKEIRPKQLFIAADGPRHNRPTEPSLCLQTRDVVATIDWPCEVFHLYRNDNLGCKIAVSSAISWFFDHVESGIILEDDCLPDPSFFTYCAELLNHYKDHSEIAMIGGSQCIPPRLLSHIKESYYFSKYPQIWGWATWRRSWQQYDVTLSKWNGSLDTFSNIKNKRCKRHFSKKFDSVKSGANDTWDYQFVHHCFDSKSLVISPAINLIENIGFDERATHTTHAASPQTTPKAYPITFPLSHPIIKSIHSKFDQLTELHVFRIPNHRWTSLKWSIAKRLKKRFGS